MNISKKTVEEAAGRLLVLSGESVLIEEFIDQVRALYPDRLLLVYQTGQELVDSYLQGNMFESRKRILVLRVLVSEELPILEQILDVPTEDYVVLIECSTVSKNKIYTKIKSAYFNVKIDKPTEAECIVWVRNFLKSKGVAFDVNIPEILVKELGSDLNFLRSEAKKISYLQRDGKINAADVSRCIIPTKDIQHFALCDLFFRKRTQEFISALKKIEESTYIKLLFTMIGQAERLFRIASYRESKMTDEEISEIMGLNKFILKTKLYPALGYFGKMKLLRLLDLLNALDLELRSSKFQKTALFESYVVKAFRL